jgi:hypothetical protein
MATAFPFKFVDFGSPPPFTIEANPDFPTETEPVCILSNLGNPPVSDIFIAGGALPFPNGPNPWQLTLHWATVGAPAGGHWQMDAFLQRITPGANLVVPATPPLPRVIAGGTPHRYDETIDVAAGAVAIPAPGLALFRLYVTLRWGPSVGVVKVAGRAQGPIVEFYLPA